MQHVKKHGDKHSEHLLSLLQAETALLCSALSHPTGPSQSRSTALGPRPTMRSLACPTHSHGIHSDRSAAVSQSLTPPGLSLTRGCPPPQPLPHCPSLFPGFWRVFASQDHAVADPTAGWVCLGTASLCQCKLCKQHPLKAGLPKSSARETSRTTTSLGI